MSIDSTLRKAAKLAKAGNRAGAAALYREVLAKFPGNTAAKQGLAALAAPAPGARRPAALPGGALGAGLIPGARPVAPPPGLADTPAPVPARAAPRPNPTPTSPGKARPTVGGPTPGAREMQALERLMAQGNVRAVVSEGQRLALLFPRAPGLLNLIAQAHGRLGQHEAALAGYDRVLEIDPGFAGAHVNKASVYALSGRFAEAEASARAALAIDPRSAQALMLLGYGLVNTDRPEEAIAAFEEAVKLAPHMVQVHLGLGNARAALGEAEPALAAFEQARAVEPDNPEVLNNIGNALVALKRYDEGVEAFEAATARDPKNTVMLTNFARALRELGRGPEAVEICRRALAVNDQLADAWSLLAGVLRELGDKAGAIEAIDKAREIDPENLAALATRWTIEIMPLDHPQFAEITRLAADENVEPGVRGTFALALFRAEDKAGAPDRAMPWLMRAKAMRTVVDPYDMDANEAVLEALMAAFRAGVAPLGAEDVAAIPAPVRPVFIVGMPRSGTSLVEQILASHSQVHGAGELDALGSAFVQFGWVPERDPRPIDTALLRDLRRQYIDRIVRLGINKTVVTDKTPLNFRHVGPALAAMPEARVLFMRRDARATCWSNYSNIFMGRANNFGNEMVDTVRMYRLHLRFLDLWRELFPDRVTVVPYERLTEHQEEESRKLVAAAGLEWEDSCLEFHKTKRAVRTVSASQVRQKMYTGSSEAWRRYEPWLGPMLDELGPIDAGR